MSLGNRNVEIKQNFELIGATFDTPRLSPCLVGILKESARKELIGVYDGGGVSVIDTDYPFPSSIRSTSAVEAESVKVFLDTNVRGLLEVSASDFEVTQQGITLFPGIELEIPMIDNGSGAAKLYKDGADYILEDPNTNFISSGIYGHVTNGDLTTIPGFSVSYIVSEVVSTHKIKLILTGSLLNDFIARPDRIFKSVTFDIDRIVSVGDTVSSLLLTSDVYISLDAVRSDLSGEVNIVTSASDISALGIKSIDNEIAWSASILNQSRDASFYFITVAEHSVSEHEAALDLAEKEELYYMLPLTIKKSITDLYVSHVESMSAVTSKKERRAYISSEFVAYDQKIFSNTGEIVKTGNLYELNDDIGDFVSKDVKAGDVMSIESTTDISQDIVGEYQVSSVASETSLTLFSKVKNFLAKGFDGATARNSSTLSTSEIITPITTAISNLESVFIEIKSGDNAGVYSVGSTAGTTDIIIVGGPVGGFASNSNITFEVFVDAASITAGETLVYSVKTEDFDAQGKSDYMKGIGLSIASQRVSLVMPGPHVFNHEVLNDDNKTVTEEFTDAQGWCMAVSVVAMRFSRAPQVPMTGESILHAVSTTADKIFSDEQLTNMQFGGVMVIQTERKALTPFIRQLITTNVSDLIFQEVTIAESVDFFAKMLRNDLRPIMGRMNLTDKNINFLKMKMETILGRTTQQNSGDGPMFGPETELLELIAATSCPDTVKMKMKLDPLFPFNAADIELFI